MEPLEPTGCVISIPLDIVGESIAFVVLPDGALIIEDQQGEESLETVANVVERRIARPFRVRGFRGEGRWVVIADGVDLVDLGTLEGEHATLLAVDGIRRFVVGDSVRAESEIPEALALEADASEPCVISCSHVDEQWWEIVVEELPAQVSVTPAPTEPEPAASAPVDDDDPLISPA